MPNKNLQTRQLISQIGMLSWKKIFKNDGLIDAKDSICFDQKCQEIENKYKDVSKTFFRYFENKLKSNLKNKVVQPKIVMDLEKN